MDRKHAAQISQLLNSQNQLVVEYNEDRILQSNDNYLYVLSNSDDVIACVELKRVQWYQFEICHLTVAPEVRRKDYGSRLLKQCEECAKIKRGRVLQCTIRIDNQPSQKLFAKNGFVQVSQFYYPDSGNSVEVWQKVISHSPKAEEK